MTIEIGPELIAVIKFASVVIAIGLFMNGAAK